MRQNQQKALPVGTLLFFLFFICSTLALANPNYWTWGNIGQNYVSPQYSNTIFSSNTPITSDNFTVKVSGYGTSFTPVAYDFNQDVYNEIVLFKATQINILDKELNSVKLFILTDGTVCGSASVMTFSDGTSAFGFITSNATGGFFSYIKWDGADYVRSSPIKFDNTVWDCAVYTGVGFPSDMAYTVAYNGTIAAINYVTGATSNYGSPVSASYVTRKNVAGYPFFGGGTSTSGAIGNVYSIYYLLDDDTIAHVYYLKAYNPTTNTFMNVTITNFPNPVGNTLVEYGSLGNAESNTVVLYTLYDGDTDPDKLFIRDALDLAAIVTTSLTKKPFGTNEYFFPVGADMNLDGNNEICVQDYDSTRLPCYYLKCWDVTRANFLNVTFPSGVSNASAIKQGSFAYIYNGTSMEYITEDYIFTRSGSNFSVAKNLTDYFVNSNTFPMVVNINTVMAENEQKSIVFSGEIYQHVLIASGTPGYCGNGVCEYGETVYNCPSDCIGTGNGTAASGTVPNFAYCNNNTWCLSDSCIQNVCTPIAGGKPCAVNAQCQSGSCDVNKHCTTPGFTKLSKDFFSLAFGFGFFDQLFLGLLIIIICGAIGVLLGAALNFVAAIALGLFGSIIGLLISTLVFEFIPIWFLVLLIFVVVFIVFMIIFLNNSGG